MGGGVYPVCPECLYRLSSAPSQPVSKENKKKSHVNQPTTYGSCKKIHCNYGNGNKGRLIHPDNALDRIRPRQAVRYIQTEIAEALVILCCDQDILTLIITLHYAFV